ncbi:FAD-binding Berberine family protein [Theobroma cacao]|uniref:FAD-binding Berberine family protein n=1 Tax=Theobroma cacao TaxID=3641 RepID=A0A061DNA3_THECC|nr:FAD-binding Berberine family protein [Theobroma cacao]
MKSPHFSMLPFLLVVLFTLCDQTLAHSHDDFLHCFSLHSADSASMSKVIYTQNNSSYLSILDVSIQNFSRCHTVGSGGHFSGRGYGILIRKYGLAADHIIDGHLIDDTGRILDRKSMAEDLFWAIKLPDDIFTDATITKVNSSQVGKKTIQAPFKALHVGGIDELIPLIQDRKRLDILLDNALPKSIFKGKSNNAKEPIPESGFEGIWSKFLEEEAEFALMMMVALGGKMDVIPDTQLPYPHRSGNLYQASYLVGWSKEENAESHKYISWIRRLYSNMAIYISKSPREAYFNYRDLDIRTNNIGYTSYAQASIWSLKYFKNNFNRLIHVKTMVDFENFFKNEQSVPPLSSFMEEQR